MWPQLLALIPGLLDKLIPDKGAADAAKLEFLRLGQAGELAAMAAETDLAKAQIAVNLADASGQGGMQRNGRPFVLWVCGIGLSWDTVLRPILTFAAALAGHPVPDMPTLQTEQLYSLLFGILGLGSLRTVEKIKGRA